MLSERKTGFVFPGQGSQHEGMGKDLVSHVDPQLSQIAIRTFEEASDILLQDFQEICFTATKEELGQTRITQPALLITSMAAFRMLKNIGETPDIVAGHSFGEYSALVAAEALSFEQGLKLASLRGIFMEEAGKINPGKMASVLKLPLNEVEEICRMSGAELATINTEGQIVIAGDNDSVTYATSLAQDKKGKVIGLDVSIASHSNLMKPAKEKMENYLISLSIHNPEIPIIGNTTAQRLYTGQEVKRELVDQMTDTVLWLDSMRKMIDEYNVDTMIEVGPGNILTGMMKRIDKSVAVRSSAEALKITSSV